MTMRLTIKNNCQPNNPPYAAKVVRTNGSVKESLGVIEPQGELEVTLWAGAELAITEQAAAPIAPNSPESAANS